MIRFQRNNELLSSCPSILSRFWDYYLRLCSPIVFARLWFVIHIFAIGLILGALSGVYLRGFFHEYTVVWRSSFVNEPHAVRLILNVFLGLPTYILSGQLISASSVNLLTSAKGSPAAFWIHVLSMTSILFVILPRTILFSMDLIYMKTRSFFLNIDINDEYYKNIIQNMVELKMKLLRDKVEPIVLLEISKFSEAIAAYIRDSFYNKNIIPMLTEFRNNGGRIADLESK
ncbi:MAG: DUF2868 domain-containing protein [Nitrospirota bacterium]|nr:DUF2868 domain-containing protein [Nitrospirota bacterium]